MDRMRWFSRLYEWLVNKLTISVKVLNRDTHASEEVTWLLDTWATNSMISNRIAKKLSFIEFWQVRIGWVHGTNFATKYLAELELPDQYGTGLLQMTWWPLEEYDFDVLIGMDVISKADFTHTIKDGKTLISFFTPHQDPIDLVEKYKPKCIIEQTIKIETDKRTWGKNNRKKKKRR